MVLHATAELRQSLIAESNGTTLERLLVEQVVTTFLQLNYHEQREANAPASDLRISEHRLKKIESVFKRHLKTLGSLASVKVLLPVDTTAAPAPVSEPTDHSELVTNGDPPKNLESTTRSVTSRSTHLHPKVHTSWSPRSELGTCKI